MAGCVEQAERRMNFAMACAEGEYELVLVGMAKIRTLNFRTLKGDTPLGSSASNGHMAVVRLLVENGADPYYPNEAGINALDIAIAAGHGDIASYLKQAKENP